MCVVCMYIAVCVSDLQFFFAVWDGEYISAISPYKTVHFVFAN